MSQQDELATLSPPDIWDRFTQQFLRMNVDTQFRVVRDGAELEAVFRIRYITVIEQGWSQPEDFPDGLERDVYDERAIHIVGHNADGVLVATGRVVLPAPRKHLPTEDFFDIEIEPRQQVVDVGRGIVRSSEQRHLVFLGLMSQSWTEMRARGFHEICGSMTKSMLRLYRLMDIHWNVLGESRPYWGKQRFPCKFHLTKTIEAYVSRHSDILTSDSE
jgi:N-acyl-L-homoserine lactone synthetase